MEQKEQNIWWQLKHSSKQCTQVDFSQKRHPAIVLSANFFRQHLQSIRGDPLSFAMMSSILYKVIVFLFCQLLLTVIFFHRIHKYIVCTAGWSSWNWKETFRWKKSHELICYLHWGLFDGLISLWFPIAIKSLRWLLLGQNRFNRLSSSFLSFMDLFVILKLQIIDV